MSKRSPGQKDLIAIYLRYESMVDALHIRALSQILAKCLFMNRPASLSVNEISRKAGELIEVEQIAIAQALPALSFLSGIQFASETGGKWRLTEKGTRQVEESLARANCRADGILTRHFNNKIPRAKLANWFRDVSTTFYSRYGSMWAATITRNRSDRPKLDPIGLPALLRKKGGDFGLGAFEDMLHAGFISFVQSRNQEDIEHHLSLAKAMLAASLVAANVGPDPITVEDFRGCEIYLDTNVLIALNLESSLLCRPLSVLALALKAIDVTLLYAPQTETEYMSVAEWKRRQVLRIVSRFTDRILHDTDDDFLQTAIRRGCRVPADFERFFEEILGPLESQLEQYGIRKDLEDQGLSDAELAEVERSARSVPGKKTWSASKHDLILNAISEAGRGAGRNCWVLSLDRGMQAFSLERSGAHEPPMWLSLDALTQVLAADGAGPGINPADSEEILLAAIRAQCETIPDAFSTEDLEFLLDVEERCADLSEERVREIVAFVSRKRLSGVSRTDPEFRLRLQRLFQREKLDLDRKLQESVAEATVLHRVVLEERARKEAVIGQLRRNLKEKAWAKAILETAAWLVLAILAAIIVYFVIKFAAPKDVSTAIQLVWAGMGPIFGCVIMIFRSVVPRLRRRLRESDLAPNAQ